MPIRSALESSGKFLQSAAPAVKDAVVAAKPKLRKNPQKATARDVGTLGLSTAILNVVVWLVNDVAGVHAPDHVSVSIAAIVAYFVARRFRY